MLSSFAVFATIAAVAAIPAGCHDFEGEKPRAGFPETNGNNAVVWGNPPDAPLPTAGKVLVEGGNEAQAALADVKYGIQAMDVSNEAGSHKPECKAVCIAGAKHLAGALSVTAPSRLTIPLGGGATAFDATAGVDCGSEVDDAADFRVRAPDGRVLWEKKGIWMGSALKVHVDLTGLDSVVLEVSGKDGIQAGWAAAKFSYAAGKRPPDKASVPAGSAAEEDESGGCEGCERRRQAGLKLSGQE